MLSDEPSEGLVRVSFSSTGGLLLAARAGDPRETGEGREPVSSGQRCRDEGRRTISPKEFRESNSWQGSCSRLSWRTSLLGERKEQRGLVFLEFANYAQGRGEKASI